MHERDILVRFTISVFFCNVGFFALKSIIFLKTSATTENQTFKSIKMEKDKFVSIAL